jgi:steroid delta-isomerase-like uncharacterized protein
MCHLASTEPSHAASQGTEAPPDPEAAPAPAAVLADLPQELREFGERWLAAWASRSPERITALCTEDVVWDDPALEEPARGRPAVIEFLESSFRAFPDLEFTLTERPLVSPGLERVAVPWKVSGTMLGALDPPGLAPTGRSFALEGVDLYELRDGLVRRMTTRYDVLTWLREIGALPARGSSVEGALMRLQRAVTRLRAR